jgi:nucleotide-binding universal stress UspA family protein
MPSPIVVGVDGSEGSIAALRWALDEARLRGSGVRVVHAYRSSQFPLAEAELGVAGGMGVPVMVTDGAEELRRAVETQARHVIDESVQRAGGDAVDGLEIERAAIEGPAAQTLIEAGRGAELLVVGSRGRGGFVGLLLGSVSQQCAQHPPCPVVILPPPDAPEPDPAGVTRTP